MNYLIPASITWEEFNPPFLHPVSFPFHNPPAPTPILALIFSILLERKIQFFSSFRFLAYFIEFIPNLNCFENIQSFSIYCYEEYSSLQAIFLSLSYRTHTDLNCLYESIQLFLYYWNEKYLQFFTGYITQFIVQSPYRPKL